MTQQEAKMTLIPSPTDKNAYNHLGWEELEQIVSQCKKCPLYQSRIQTVFGNGNRQADLLIVGEAPGAQEDKQGQPFVGRSGQLLNQMLHSVGVAREEVYVTNILKSRPPNNRPPKPNEVAACLPYLLRQIELLNCKLILATGRTAVQYLLQSKTPLSRLRGDLHLFQNKLPLIATYHPAYLLRYPENKDKTIEDLKYVVKTLNNL